MLVLNIEHNSDRNSEFGTILLCISCVVQWLRPVSHDQLILELRNINMCEPSPDFLQFEYSNERKVEILDRSCKWTI